jgi:hypothetical protein
MVVHWGKWYKSIYEMPAVDRPEMDIIQDDNEVDLWFDSYMRDNARRAAVLRQQQNRYAPPPQAQATAIFGNTNG